MLKKKEISPAIKVPVLALVIYILLAVTGQVTFLRANDTTDMMISTIVLQILIFILPALFYSRLTGLSFTRKLRLRMFAPGRIILILALFGVMVCGSVLLNLLTYSFTSMPEGFSARSAYSVADKVKGINPVYAVLTFCLIPAICEEFVFRGVIMSEYAGESLSAGLILSALLFGMSHFYFTELLSYVFCGIVLAAAVYITKSLYAAIILHFANNLFSLYLAPYIWTVVLEPRGPLFTVFIVAILFLLCLALAFREAEAAYYEYAYDPAWAGPPVSPSKKGAFLTALASPTLILCVLLFIIVTLATA